MTNERKSSEISDGYDYLFDKRERNASYYSALEMAEWKDQQFKEYLEEKLKSAEERLHHLEEKSLPEDTEGVSCATTIVMLYNEIINELFPKEEADCSNNDE